MAILRVVKMPVPTAWMVRFAPNERSSLFLSWGGRTKFTWAFQIRFRSFLLVFPWFDRTIHIQLQHSFGWTSPGSPIESRVCRFVRTRILRRRY